MVNQTSDSKEPSPECTTKVHSHGGSTRPRRPREVRPSLLSLAHARGTRHTLHSPPPTAPWTESTSNPVHQPARPRSDHPNETKRKEARRRQHAKPPKDSGRAQDEMAPTSRAPISRLLLPPSISPPYPAFLLLLLSIPI